MKKIFGIEAEVNVTADENICKGIGNGLAKGSIKLDDLFQQIKPELLQVIKDKLSKRKE